MQFESPSFAEFYAISDIHMGGRRDGDDDFQIFNRGDRLAAFVRHVAARRPDSDVALVLNGDVIDSLAEDEVTSYVATDPASALGMMEHLYADPAFKPVWEELSTFVRTPRRHLVIVVGNHDIELALPLVQNSIRARLARGNIGARARITFATHGSGFACNVGRARVFCTHGNEVDPWNWVDFTALGQLANALEAGRSVSPSRWQPNAGTKLVVDVMNAVKQRFPFIDLLKPEGAAVWAVLMTLDRELMGKIDWRAALPVWGAHRRGRDITENLLGGCAQSQTTVPPGATAHDLALELLGPNLREIVTANSGRTEDELLLAAERMPTTAADPLDPLQPETLSVWDGIAGWIGLVEKSEGLRRALLDLLAEDCTFDVVDHDDRLFCDMEARIGDGIDFVVTGHTHLPRAMTYSSGCHYFNCGTWIRTLRLTREVLDDAKAFKERLWPVPCSARMRDLDRAQIPGPNGAPLPLVFDRTNAVRIMAGDTEVTGELVRVQDADGGNVILETEPGTSPLVARVKL